MEDLISSQTQRHTLLLRQTHTNLTQTTSGQQSGKVRCEQFVSYLFIEHIYMSIILSQKL